MKRKVGVNCFQRLSALDSILEDLVQFEDFLLGQLVPLDGRTEADHRAAL